MLKEENKIFKNLYNNHGWELEKAIEREDWKNTKEIIKTTLLFEFKGKSIMSKMPKITKDLLLLV